MFRRRIVVGAPGEWNAMDARVPVVVAMHEDFVRRSPKRDYAGMEWEALTRLAALMHGAHTELAQVHASWLASLELRPLLDVLEAEGRIDRAEHEGLVVDVDQRRARLVAIGAR